MKKQTEFEPSGANAGNEPVTVGLDLSGFTDEYLCEYLNNRLAGVSRDQELDYLSGYVIDELRRRQLHAVTVKIAAVAWRNHCGFTGRGYIDRPENELLEWYKTRLDESRQQP